MVEVGGEEKNWKEGEGESLKKTRERNGQLRFSPRLYTYGVERRGDKGIAHGDASSPSTNPA